MKADKPTSTFVLAPEGTQVARCYQLIHIGTNMEDYQGEPQELNKIRLTFELPLKTHVFKDGDTAKPIVISQEYTLSMGAKANLRKLIEGIVGKMSDEVAYKFEIDDLLGKVCLLNIVHKTSKNGKERAEIATASPLVDGMEAPAQVNPTQKLTYETWDAALFIKLPQFLRDKMISSKEFKEKFGGATVTASQPKVEYPEGEINPDSIPF